MVPDQISSLVHGVSFDLSEICEANARSKCQGKMEVLSQCKMGCFGPYNLLCCSFDKPWTTKEFVNHLKITRQ